MIPQNTKKITNEMILEFGLEQEKISREFEKYIGMSNIIRFLIFDTFQRGKFLGKFLIFLKKHRSKHNGDENSLEN